MYVQTSSYNGSTTGATNSNGYVYLYLTAPGFLESMYVTINGGNYEVLTSSNTYTSTSYYLYPVYNLGLDMNQNDVVDVWENSLAQTFCPKIFQEQRDNGSEWGATGGWNATLEPMVVEAMDLNGDNILDANDVLVQVRDLSGNIVGDSYAMDGLYVYDFVQEWWFPYSNLYPERVKRLQAVFGKLGLSGSENYFYFLPHYRWATGNSEEGNVSWYTEWNERRLSINHYGLGFVYVFFDGSGSNPQILYNMHFPFNASSNRHEGDWQGIVVELDSQNPGQADIVSVEYHFHGDKTIRTIPVTYSESIANALSNETFDDDGNGNPAFANKYFITDGTHPVAFSGGRIDELGVEGWGSHAMYPCPGKWERGPIQEYVVENGNVSMGTKMFMFNTYQNFKIMPSKEYVLENLTNDPEYSWVVFGGYWGDVVSFPSADQTTWPQLLNTLGGPINQILGGNVQIIPDVNIAAISPYGGIYD